MLKCNMVALNEMWSLVNYNGPWWLRELELCSGTKRPTTAERPLLRAMPERCPLTKAERTKAQKVLRNLNKMRDRLNKVAETLEAKIRQESMG